MTHQEIINKAKDLIEAEVEGQLDPTWTPAMFEQWLVEGQNNLVLKIKNELLSFLLATSTVTTIPNDFIKLIMVNRDGKQCFIKNIINTANSLYDATVEFPTVYQSGKELKIKPTGATSVEVIYIRKPVFVNVSDENELPIDWQFLLPNYICSKALYKDKKYNDGNNYLQIFDNEIAIINAKG